MSNSPEPPVPDPRTIELVQDALDRGSLPDAGALRRRVDAPVEAIEAALAVVMSYQACVVAERERRQHSAGDLDLAGEVLEVLPAGTRIGDFEIIERLGAGAMGVVYRARQASLGSRLVALKVLPRSLASGNIQFEERFRREAALAASIHHPNVAEVYGIATEGDVLGFAMRLIEGRTLHEVLVDQVRSDPRAIVTPEHVRASVSCVRDVACPPRGNCETGEG